MNCTSLCVHVLQVHRTSTGNLPVYTDIRARGARVLTKVRLVRGDLVVRVHMGTPVLPATCVDLNGPKSRSPELGALCHIPNAFMRLSFVSACLLVRLSACLLVCLSVGVLSACCCPRPAPACAGAPGGVVASLPGQSSHCAVPGLH